MTHSFTPNKVRQRKPTGRLEDAEFDGFYVGNGSNGPVKTPVRQASNLQAQGIRPA
jgi:hypothetical protein